MSNGCVVFDWGDTLMVDLPEYDGPMAEWPRVMAVANAVDALERLRAGGWSTALATNAADSEEPEIRAALARVGLDGLIDRVYCSRGVGHAKPSAEFFAFIVRDLGLEPRDLVMIGDNYMLDVDGANRSGIPAVLYRPGAALGAGGGESWRVVGDLAELPDLLSSWATRG